ncbi:MAG: hypothetical protein HY908_29730 [Myxococcales bacterium]|nr:hypothetical protein [Myxococcales bacterium]
MRYARSVAFLLVAGAGLGAPLGCATARRATLPQLQQRAAYDLACPPQWLELVQIDARTKVVGGCGRRLVYLEDCVSLGDAVECAWRVDSPPASLGWAPPPVTAGYAPPPAPTASGAPARSIATQLFGPGEVPPPVVSAPPTARATAPADPLALPYGAVPTARSYPTELYGEQTQPMLPPSGRPKPRDLFPPPPAPR